MLLITINVGLIIIPYSPQSVISLSPAPLKRVCTGCFFTPPSTCSSPSWFVSPSLCPRRLRMATLQWHFAILFELHQCSAMVATFFLLDRVSRFSGSGVYLPPGSPGGPGQSFSTLGVGRQIPGGNTAEETCCCEETQ